MKKKLTANSSQATAKKSHILAFLGLSTVNCQLSAPRGFTLLLAVLISSVLLALGSAIFDIVSKEIVLSSSGRESQFAFYAADTGVECSLYWDFKHDAFATTSPVTQFDCGGQTVDLTRTIQNPGGLDETLITTFEFPFNSGDHQPCVAVQVTRQYFPTRTTIETAGYNTCDVQNLLRLERAIRVTY